MLYVLRCQSTCTSRARASAVHPPYLDTAYNLNALQDGAATPDAFQLAVQQQHADLADELRGVRAQLLGALQELSAQLAGQAAAQLKLSQGAQTMGGGRAAVGHWCGR